MKKPGKVIGRALCYAVMECPFCGNQTTENPTMPWCVNCRTEYYDVTNRRTGETRIMFDDQRKTPRFAWGKALNAAGGVRIGSRKIEEAPQRAAMGRVRPARNDQRTRR